MKLTILSVAWLLMGILATYSYEKVVGEDNPVTLTLHFLLPPISLMSTGFSYLIDHETFNLNFRIFK